LALGAVANVAPQSSIHVVKQLASKSHGHLDGFALMCGVLCPAVRPLDFGYALVRLWLNILRKAKPDHGQSPESSAAAAGLPPPHISASRSDVAHDIEAKLQL